jgi:hypothetical protein
MTSGIALILISVSLAVLVAVAASGIGPIKSLRRSLSKLSDLTDEVDRLQRSVERLDASTNHLREHP